VISAVNGGLAVGRTNTVYLQHFYRRFISADPRVIGPAVLVGAVAAATLAVVTPLPAVAAVGIGLLLGVLVWVVLSLRQGAAQERARRAAARQARGLVLTSLAPVQLAAAEQNLRTLLSPHQALIPLRARHRERTQLLGWCTDPTAAPVRILGGPSGVGKTRLAVDVARALPEGWAAGRCATGRVRDVWPAVAACQDPTLIIVDDADTESAVPTLIELADGQPEAGRDVKVLLIVRDADAYAAWPGAQPCGARKRPSVTLGPIGEASDRCRWFAQIAVAAAAALGRARPPVSEADTGPVGADNDPMTVTQARGVLAGFTSSPRRIATLRTAGLDELAGHVVDQERARWIRAVSADHFVPPNIRPDTLVDAVLSLSLVAALSQAEAMHTLRRLPGLRALGELALLNVVRWAGQLYPASGPGPLLAPTPDFLDGALLAELARPDHAELLSELDYLRGPNPTPVDEADGAAGAPGSDRQDTHLRQLITRLTRASVLFPSVQTLLVHTFTAHPDHTALAVETAILTGPLAQTLQPLLVRHLIHHGLPTADASRLLKLIGERGLHRLCAALQVVIVEDVRRRCEVEQSERLAPPSPRPLTISAPAFPTWGSTALLSPLATKPSPSIGS
jgi:hypothetical protein